MAAPPGRPVSPQEAHDATPAHLAGQRAHLACLGENRSHRHGRRARPWQGVPELANAHARWPYVAIGVGYAVLGVALTPCGFQRRREVDRAIASESYAGPQPGAIAGFALAAFLLRTATA